MKFHHLLQNRYDSWASLEAAMEATPSAQEKGEIFEEFVYCYLHLNRDYYQIKDLYRAKDIPSELREKLKLELTDYGVDGVFVLQDDTIAAYQAKFRSHRGTATVRELATFWSEASRADYKYVIANATMLPPQAGKHSYSVLADKFDELDQIFFDSLYELTNAQAPKVFVKAVPDAHQVRMVEKTIQGFKAHDRGKLIAACGAGKTLTSLWIIEGMEVETVLILVPSLALIKQTLEAWAKHKSDTFSYLCVCSDSSVVDAKELDYGEYEVSEVDFPVTTDPEIISKFMRGDIKRKYVFSTYNSAQAVSQATKGQTFDLIIFDEAHRTAGQKDSNLYSVGLTNEGIAAKKRLFMTATERLVQPWILDRAAEEDRVIFSMDDKAVYGELFDRYTFGEAIQDGVISDYRILLTAVTASEVESLIQENRLIIAEGDEKERLLTAQNIYKQSVLYKAMQQYRIRKTISFHSTVKRAKSFIQGSGNEAYSLQDLFSLIWPESTGQRIYFDWVDGSMPAGLRKQKLREFEGSDLGIISNAKCLTEGVDVPIIDSIYFVDPKTSLVDIVQACGRALRKSRGDNADIKTAYFVVPIIIHDEEDVQELDTGKFETLLNLIQALRGQDERMADWIDKINLGYVKGEGPGPDDGGDGPIVINFPQEFDLSKFTNQIQVRIYEGIKGPPITKTDFAFAVRRSNFRKVFKALGDYAYSSYINNLVEPTIEKFKSADELVEAKKLTIVNNNVSHTFRLGLIEKEGSSYRLTDIGKNYRAKEISSEEVFRRAMLAFNCKDDTEVALFPYRAALNILSRVGSVNKVEFLYGIYSLQDSSSSSIETSINRILEIRKEYPNILQVNDANKTVVLKELNAKFEENFSEADLWANTTATNKFIYFKNHLSLFDGIAVTSTSMSLTDDKRQDIVDLIESVESLST